jgi:hypothetical protein
MAIDRFAEVMKARMNTKRHQGWKGWDYRSNPNQLLYNAAKAVANDDLESAVDCANYCMMIWNVKCKEGNLHDYGKGK